MLFAQVFIWRVVHGAADVVHGLCCVTGLGLLARPRRAEHRPTVRVGSQNLVHLTLSEVGALDTRRPTHRAHNVEAIDVCSERGRQRNCADQARERLNACHQLQQLGVAQVDVRLEVDRPARHPSSALDQRLSSECPCCCPL